MDSNIPYNMHWLAEEFKPITFDDELLIYEFNSGQSN